MEYIPGKVHESLTTPKYILIGGCFNIPYYKVRLRDANFNDNTDCIELEKGDIIKIRYFKYEDASTAYTYVDGYYRNNEFFEYNIESVVSMEFIYINMDSNKIFEDVTNSFIRDNKLKQILNETN